LIQQLANDTAGLLDALKIQKTDVLRYSMGSFVAQQLTVTLVAQQAYTSCCIMWSKRGYTSKPSNCKIVNHTPITPEEVKMILSPSFGSVRGHHMYVIDAVTIIHVILRLKES
jgi:hypothetical protein